MAAEPSRCDARVEEWSGPRFLEWKRVCRNEGRRLDGGWRFSTRPGRSFPDARLDLVQQVGHFLGVEIRLASRKVLPLVQGDQSAFPLLVVESPRREVVVVDVGDARPSRWSGERG